jgi:hypothetical protein|nr:MAG TPA: hypothetical protein [Caudoviricetes sp.]
MRKSREALFLLAIKNLTFFIFYDIIYIEKMRKE